MQWLVDLIIATIGIPPTFIDRGDPANYDFTTGDFTTDGFWHDLDLSGIVPSNAKAVVMYAYVKAPSIKRYLQIKVKGKSNFFNIATMRTQTSNCALTLDLVSPINSDGMLEYKTSPVAFTTIYLTIKGWWL